MRSSGTDDENKQGKEALTESNEDEVWYQEMALSEKTNDERGFFYCSTRGCGNHAVAVWATNLNPDDLWFFCEECQQTCIGESPKDVRVKRKNACFAKDLANGIDTMAKGQDEKDVLVRDHSSVGIMMPVDENETKTIEPQEMYDVWDLVAIPACKLQGVQCSTDGCCNQVVTAWASNKLHDWWYCCAKCQEKEFGCLSNDDDDAIPDGCSDADDYGYDEEEVEDVVDDDMTENEGGKEDIKIKSVRCIPNSEQSETPCEIYGEHPVVLTGVSVEEWNYCEEGMDTDVDGRAVNILAIEEDGYDFCLGQDIRTDGFILV
jgi:hypothetical protein